MTTQQYTNVLLKLPAQTTTVENPSILYSGSPQGENSLKGLGQHMHCTHRVYNSHSTQVKAWKQGVCKTSARAGKSYSYALFKNKCTKGDEMQASTLYWEVNVMDGCHKDKFH